MSTIVYTNNQHYQDIANAIRNKNGTNNTYTPAQMAAAINALDGSGGSIALQTKTVNPTTSQQIIQGDAGYIGLSQVTVNAIQTETKNATPTTATQNITPTSGKYLTGVTVNPIPSQYIIPTGTYNITSNGTGIDIAQYATVNVNVAIESGTPTLQSKSVSPTESIQVVTPDTGYDGLDQVNVGAISSTYIGSGITQRSSTDLSTSGATVTAPAGYYTTAVSKSVASGTAGTPTASKGTVSNNSISVTPSVTNTTGYIIGDTKTGTAVTINASELVSGNKAITENGNNIDVTNYATVSVNVQGGSSAISVVDTTDAAGGTIRTITALDISDTTAVASDVALGKYFYTADGTKTAGTASVGGFDCPVFDMVIDAYGNVTSLSCNKTYQQCLGLLTASNVNSVGVFKNGYSHSPSSYTYAPSSGYDDYYQGQRVLYYYNFGMSDHSVMYKSDGSLVVVDGDSL